MIDRQTALILTANLSRSAFTSNREFGVLVRESSVVEDMLDVFNADWSHQDPTRTSGLIQRSPDMVFSPDNARSQIVKLLRSARRTLLIEMEFLKDDEITRVIGERTKAGVAVQVLMAAPKKVASSDIADSPGVEEEDVVDALEALSAVGVREFRFLRSPYMHAKMILADGRQAYVGSVNLTENSMNHNREIGILVQDPAILRQLQQTSRADWQRGQTGREVDFLSTLPLFSD